MTHDHSARRVVLASVVLGVASGGRSTLGPVVARLSTGSRSTWSRVAALSGVAAELVGDKLPIAPSRLKPASLAGRVTAGAVTGSMLAANNGVGRLVPAAAGAGAALAGSYAGAAWRGAWARTGRPDLAAAVVEDAAVVGLAYGTYKALKR
ncbi:hypothetical protein [Mumia zhuanghuii]|uniref:DUF4126 domain-containing protein n=1 Tax=Mumia zhuanghuii TaxID=2585211 RepID=A0A5C4MXS7_9ACTN|nr:hypothetical protein [Mumia zhuanghuii]TNC47569.1 hypothetical protein FHE65_09700 [Mumia zhuanghuii]TNC50257.1 hypothetical protein FHE65_04060 [Mumia zhuanghuii]